MLDTNTCIYAMKGVKGFEPRLPLHDCAISVIVLGELEWGARRSSRATQNMVALSEFTGAVRVVGIDREVAREYGWLRAHLHSTGQPIGPNDLWIAAHALACDVPLITHNLSEFGRVPSLVAESWLTASS